MDRVLDELALRTGPVQLGLVTVEKGLKPLELTLDEIPEGKLKDYLLASAACFPLCGPAASTASSIWTADTAIICPPPLAARMGAEELVCVDLEGVGTRPTAPDCPPSWCAATGIWATSCALTPRWRSATWPWATLTPCGLLAASGLRLRRGRRGPERCRCQPLCRPVCRHPAGGAGGISCDLDRRSRPAAEQTAGPGPGAAGRRRGYGGGPHPLLHRQDLVRRLLDRCDYGRIRVFFPLLDGQAAQPWPPGPLWPPAHFCRQWCTGR